MANNHRFSCTKWKNNKRRIPSSQYHEDIRPEGSKYFSVFDFPSGFHQIPMYEFDAQKTAFSTPHGHHYFDRIPFELKNALCSKKSWINIRITGNRHVYLDDIVIYASLTEYHSKFNKLVEQLRQMNLQL